MRALKYFAIALAFASSACGGGIRSKDDAAKALNRLMMAAENAKAVAQADLLMQRMAQEMSSGKAPGEFNGSVTARGKSGSATVTYKVEVRSNGQTATHDTAFLDFSYDGKNTFDGTGSTSFATAFEPGSLPPLTVTTSMKASVTMSGEYSTKMTCDVTITMIAFDVFATSGKVPMTISGIVSSDGRRFTFNNERFEVDVEP